MDTNAPQLYARYQVTVSESTPDGIKRKSVGIGMHKGEIAAHAFAQRTVFGYHKIHGVQLHPVQPLAR